MKKRVVWAVTVEGNIDLFDLIKERIRALEISGLVVKQRLLESEIRKQRG